ncbi:MAG TPA: MucR family transcriptional regulator [Stellaceae bacterium]|nr:MucR family transcriptional regulator [Stellaceae bacterium]
MIEETATIVSAFLRRNQVVPTEIPALIASVNAALSHLGQAPAAKEPERTPAISIRRSVMPNEITCLDCGYRGQMLKRHLMTRHKMTPEQYRARWGLASDYPMVAPAYATRRSALAKQLGLGRRRGPGTAKTPAG